MERKNFELRGENAPTRRTFLQRVVGTGVATAAGIAMLPGLSWARIRYVAPYNTASDIAILNFALLLERLEAEFYNTNASKDYLAGGLGVSPLQSLVNEIRDHENAHVTLLQGLLAAQATAAPTFQGLDAPTLTQFLTMAQMFEDVGVAAYLGQVPSINDKGILATLGGIMAVEARHAGGIRAYREGASTAAGGDPSTTLTQDREAVNRALPMAQVLTLINPFIGVKAA